MTTETQAATQELAAKMQACTSTSCEDGHWFDNPNQPCELCKGSGSVARYPKLRRVHHQCEGKGVNLLDSGQLTQAVNCKQCGGDGRYLEWHLENKKQVFEDAGTKGSGWLLIPEPEWTGVLMEVPGFRKVQFGEKSETWQAWYYLPEIDPQNWIRGEGPTLNDALGAAIKSRDAGAEG